ncbi:hypothetical protein [Corynebacterium minutissimum]|uniref:hypothetical protein n=1 Tax=Corynebacterium minutissimum TaxID=38301 RepID=UPI001EF2D178|nr:hypothetical protein [Corynebacterium minutissimum]MCG7239582.1 hypothetical protein [Corynebacterium minutissimum]
MTSRAKSLEVVKVVCAAPRNVKDVVDLQVLGAAALHTLMAVTGADGFAQVVRCTA